MSDERDGGPDDMHSMAVAKRCCAVLRTYRRKKLDPDRLGFRLIADFAWALGVDFNFTLVRKPMPDAARLHTEPSHDD